MKKGDDKMCGGSLFPPCPGRPPECLGEGEAETKGQERLWLEALRANHTLCPLVLRSLSD